MGKLIQQVSRSVYYWQIFSREDIQTIYHLLYQIPNLGLVYKKLKIEQILGSYRRD